MTKLKKCPQLHQFNVLEETGSLRGEVTNMRNRGEPSQIPDERQEDRQFETKLKEQKSIGLGTRAMTAQVMGPGCCCKQSKAYGQLNRTHCNVTT